MFPVRENKPNALTYVVPGCQDESADCVCKQGVGAQMGVESWERWLIYVEAGQSGDGRLSGVTHDAERELKRMIPCPVACEHWVSGWWKDENG